MNNPFQLPTLGDSTDTNSTKKYNKKPANFIEALRNQGQAATTGVAGNFIDQITGKASNYQNPTNTVNNFPQKQEQAFNFAEYLKSRENKVRQEERMLHGQQQRSETVLFTKKEEQAKKEIEFIKEEIKKILVSSEDLSVELLEAEKTIMTRSVETGVYQINFFQRIKRLIILAKKRISEAQNWLELFNHRTNQKSYYWGQVKKSGAKFMLSQERQLVTQTG